MKHVASLAFWEAYRRLPENVRALADKNYALLKQNPQHPSLHLKGWALLVRSDRWPLPCAVEVDGGLLWFWIGSHAYYDELIK